MFYQFLDKRMRLQFLSLVASLSILFAAATVGLSYWRLATGTENRLALAALDSAQLFTSTLVGAALTAGFLVLMFSFLYRGREPEDAIRVLGPQETQDHHEEALATTEFWFHNGHIGRWVRLEVLPHLVKRSGRVASPYRVILAILDPRDDELCERFAQYRTDHRVSKKDRSDETDIKLELLATVVRAAAASRSPRLDVQVYFKDRIGWTRLDVTDSFAFRTNPGKRRECVAYAKPRVPQGTSDYDSARFSFWELEQRQSPVNLDNKALGKTDVKKLNSSQIRNFLRDNDLISIIEDSEIDSLKSRVRDSFHPYK